jgi:(1->4)-alpha-D-glucan 1-alpha-D-glucosylmutase
MLFMEGAYLPLTAEGELKDHICGFARQRDNKAVLVIVPRFMTQVSHFTVEVPFGEKVWGKTGLLLPDEIPGTIFKNVLTGEEVKVIHRAGKRVLALADVFSCFPVAMLEGTMDFGSKKETI